MKAYKEAFGFICFVFVTIVVYGVALITILRLGAYVGAW